MDNFLNMITPPIQYILDLGPAVMLPLVIIIFALCLGLKLGKAFNAGLMIGIGFIGIGIVITLMRDTLGPAAEQMAQNFGLNLTVIDLGWPGTAPMTWASKIAIVAIPVAILVNLIMLALKMTRVVNVDIWNIWHMTFTGALVHIVTGNYWLGILGVVVHAVFSYKFGDWFQYDTRDYFGLEGIAVPHGTSAYCAPFAVMVDAILDKIPGINKIDIDTEKLEKKLGAFGQPIIVGFILGIIVGILAGYDVKQILQLAVSVSAVMYLMPKVIKPIMEGLLPISEAAREKLSAKFGGGEFLIGLDPALLLGDANVISAGLLFIPLTVIIAAIGSVTFGNRVLPFGDLATIGFFIAMAVAIHHGNIFRTLISGSFIMFITIWISNQTVELQTILAKNANMLGGKDLVGSLDQGGSPITYMMVQIFQRTNIVGLLVIAVIYFIGIAMTYRRYKAFQKKEKAELQGAKA